MAALGDFLNSINNKTGIIEPEEVQKGYVPFVINRTLSYFIDTVVLANEMNHYVNTPKNYQYLFYVNSVRKKKRFTKWHKSEHDKYLEVVKEYYDYSYEKANDALKLLTVEQCKELEKRLYRGGKNEFVC